MSEVDEILDDQADRASTVTFSDDDLALRFTKRHEDELRYTEQWHKWHRWNGAYWPRTQRSRCQTSRAGHAARLRFR